jgi:hypothetical protein
MSNVMDAGGNKAWIQMEWEQVDAIVRHELRQQIITTSQPEGWRHPDDIEYDKILLPALKIVYEYFAGEKNLIELEKELNANSQTV